MRALLLLLAFLELGEALNVLFYTAVIGTSHVYFLNSAIKALLKNGHTVDVVMSVYNEMVTVKLQEGVRRVYHNRHSDPNHWEKNAHHFSNMFEKKWTSFGQFEHFQVTGYELCKIALKDQKLQDFIQDGNYSIGVTSDYDPCGGILFTAAGIASSASLIPTPLLFRQVVNSGLPSIASVYGKMLAPENDGSLLDRFVNLLRLTHYHYVIAPKWENKYNELINIKYGSSFPDVATIERNLDVVFANSNEILEKQRPLSQKIKYIGGIGVKKAKQLPEEFETLLSRNSKYFVLFSFGTQVPAEKMPKTIRKNFVEAFKTFPNVTFLWKYDNIQLDSELFDGVENVQRLQWLPQAELLHDSRVKLFISHMGLNSYLETSTAGVPVLAIPLFADQQNNAQNARDREMGLLLGRDQLTEKNIENCLRELLENPKFSLNAQKIAKMMKEKPQKSEEIFVKWLEYAAENPGLHKVFHLPGSDLTPFQYYCGDIVLLVCLVVLFSIYSVFVILKQLSFRISKKKID